MGRESLTEEQIKAAFEFYRKGETIDKVAERYFVCDRTLRRLFRKRRLYKRKSKCP